MGIKTFIEKIRYAITRNKLVNKFINGKYDLDVIYMPVDGIYGFRRIYYSASIYRDGYYYYSINLTGCVRQRCSIKELRKNISEKLYFAKKYEFDDSYLAHIVNKVILKIYM